MRLATKFNAYIALYEMKNLTISVEHTLKIEGCNFQLFVFEFAIISPESILDE